MKRERERLGFSQAELADRLTAELSPLGGKAYPTTIAKIEARDAEKPRTIRLDEAAALARIFGKSLDEMLQIRSDLPLEVALHQTIVAARQMSKALRADASELRSVMENLTISELESQRRNLSDWSDASLRALAITFALPAVYRDIAALQSSLTRILELGGSEKAELVRDLTDFLAEDNDHS